MTSNEDLMKFLLEMEDRRAKDREADMLEMKQLREKERLEDMQEIIKVIDKCVGEKVHHAIEPFREKTIAVEKDQTELKNQVDFIVGELRALQEMIVQGVGASSNNRTMAEVIPDCVSVNQYQREQNQQVGGQGGDGGGEELHDEHQLAVSVSRRTVGLSRIDVNDLERQRKEQYGGAKTEEEEKVLAVKEFLNLELKFDKNELDLMEIERIFAPAKGDLQCLYVTFKYESSVRKIFEKTRYMRRGSRILMYVPKQFYNRFDKLRTFEYNLRMQEKCQTRIKMGYRDLLLFKRFRGERWEEVPLPKDLPPVALGSSASKAEHGSQAPGTPAPGRPDQDRSATHASDISAKVARAENGKEKSQSLVIGESLKLKQSDVSGSVIN